MDVIEEEFFDWYAGVEAPDLVRFSNYVEGGIVVDGSLWLLWNTPRGRPALVTVHDDAGAIIARLILEGTETERPEWDQGPPRRRFAVDQNRQRLYLMDQNALSTSWFALTPGVLQVAASAPES